MCLRAQAWVAAHAPVGAMELLPCQSDRRAEVAPQVPFEACMQAMQFVLPDGSVFAGEQAFAKLLPLLRAPWKYLAILFHLPGSRWIAPKVYGWVARHRLQISGLFAEKTEGASCSIEKGCR
jgi:predicted DCC family thiol-disulfide oxidoreductase YuxK